MERPVGDVHAKVCGPYGSLAIYQRKMEREKALSYSRHMNWGSRRHGCMVMGLLETHLAGPRQSLQEGVKQGENQ